MSPQWSDLVLSTHVPHVELDILICDGLDVESNGWDGRYILAKFQLVKNRGLSCGVKSEHEQSHLFRSKDLCHHLRNLSTHCAGLEFGGSKR